MTGELIQVLEIAEPPANCLLVMADLSSLYLNIVTKKAFVALDLLLTEGKFAQTPPLVQFTRLAFENNFLKSEFSDDRLKATKNQCPSVMQTAEEEEVNIWRYFYEVYKSRSLS